MLISQQVILTVRGSFVMKQNLIHEQRYKFEDTRNNKGYILLLPYQRNIAVFLYG